MLTRCNEVKKTRLYVLMLFAGLAFSMSVSAQPQSPVTHTFFFVGDAGEPYITKSELGKVLRTQVNNAGPATTVLYLGDNIYPAGLPAPGHRYRATAESILEAQVNWIRGLPAKGIFIPGNHDWQRWGKKGFDYIMHQQQWIDSLHDQQFTFLPREGCPGPIEVAVDDKTALVIIDTQWLLHQWDKPGEEEPCEAKTTAEVLALLADVLQRHSNKRIVVAAHHPLITYGDHGGVFTLKDHLFPLRDINPNLYVPMPVVGSIYPLYRKFFGHIQDTAHPVYKEFSQAIRDMLKEYPGSIYVAGHEHTLQYIVKDSTHFIVSGAGAKVSDVRKKRYAQLAESVTGFARLSIHQNGEALLSFYRVDAAKPNGEVIFTASIPPRPGLKALDTSAAPAVANGQHVGVKASNLYYGGDLHKKILGENYRKEWHTEVDVPVFDIGSEKGGLKILQKGGGQQTLSLRLADSAGHEYVVRSVEKYPEKAVPEMLRKTFAQDLVQDQISASHPYAALVIAPLADAAGIYHTNPRLMYIPDDARFGPYRKEFANTLVLFEERPAGDWSEASFFGNSEKIINTTKLLEKLAKDNDNAVDQEFVLYSRLFDMVIGDWDRHDDQWRWATFESKKGEVYRPIPRDRDQAFFVSEGLLSKLLSRKWALPKFEGFNDNISWPSGLSFNARYFDRSFLTALSEDQWVVAAKKLQASLTDEVIENAISQWPEQIYALHGRQIVRKLKARRDNLHRYALAHYKFLARAVDVVGSDKTEQFNVESLRGGDVRVSVFKTTKEGEKGRKLYDRLFRHGETKEVRLYGLGGEDVFTVSGEPRKGIVVRVIGGNGNDTFSAGPEQSAAKVLFYDQHGQYTMKGARVRNRTSPDEQVNEYNRMAFRYDMMAPLVFGNYNPDDGVFVGGGFLHITHGFRKQPYKQRHLFLATVAPLTWSFNFRYQARFTEVIGKWNLELNADVRSPNYVNNFFGLGNETVFNDDIEDVPGISVDEPIDYYRYRFTEIRFEPSLSRFIGSGVLLKAGPVFQRIEMEAPGAGKDRYIEDYARTLDYDLFEVDNTFAGAGVELLVDKRNHPVFTRRGLLWNSAGRVMESLNGQAPSFSSYESSLAIYHSFRSASRVVFAVRFGGGRNIGNYAFYQAQVLDGKTELRGYRKTRFYGDSKLYSNFEIRLRLLSFRSYLFPASVGILGFHDLGRVWYKDASGIDPSAPDGTSGRWHRGYGGGIWFTPFNATVLSTELGHSADDGFMAYIRLGFLF